VPLGILEVGLGVTLVLTSGQSGAVSAWLASAWALLGGVVLVSDALVVRRRLIGMTPDSGVRSSP
jgi:drug/metabolite transporter (DMT)-like permease